MVPKVDALEITAREPGIRRGRIVRVAEDRLWVTASSVEPGSPEKDPVWECDVVEGAVPEGRTAAVGDEVVVVPPPGVSGRGVVMGWIVPYRPEKPERQGEVGEVRRIGAEEVVIEAGTRLELRVGGNRVLLTRDGRVLIRGETIVSRATGVHKIRGGAVRIN